MRGDRSSDEWVGGCGVAGTDERFGDAIGCDCLVGERGERWGGERCFGDIRLDDERFGDVSAGVVCADDCCASDASNDMSCDWTGSVAVETDAATAPLV